MSWHAHKPKSTRKLITLREWANRLKVKPSTISWHLERYKRVGNTYDPYDIYSVLDFYDYVKNPSGEN
jgi:hypothetical protein